MTNVTKMLTSHVERYKTVINYHSQEPIKFVYIESNNDALASDYVSNEIYKLDKQNTRIESRDPKNIGRVGIWTHPSSKRIYNDMLVLIMSEGRLRIAEDLISVNPQGRIDELLLQMRNFRRTEMPENEDPAFQDQIKVRYSAKGGGMKDDLLLSLMICVRWMVEKRTDQKFLDEANIKGIVDY